MLFRKNVLHVVQRGHTTPDAIDYDGTIRHFDATDSAHWCYLALLLLLTIVHCCIS